MSHSNDQSFGDDGHLNGIFDQLDAVSYTHLTLPTILLV